MCLSTVTSTVQSSKIIISGYKEFNGSKNKPEFQSYYLVAGKKVPLDTWIKAEGPPSIKANDGKSYPAYFHIYEEEDDKNKYSRVDRTRVFFRGLKVIGTQGSEKCYIAEEMYVPSDPNSWPPVEKKASLTPPTPPKDSPVKVIIEKLSATLDELKKIAGNA